MSEEEKDFDELPPITVNTCVRDKSRFSMPRADELASQRAHELRREDEIRRLRLRDRERERDDCAQRPARPAPSGSESSESEGESALAAAVAALRRAAPPAVAAPRPSLAALAAALAAALPPAAAAPLHAYARAAAAAAAAAASPRALARLHNDALEAAADALVRREASDACGVGAWACCAAVAGGGGARAARLARALAGAPGLREAVAAAPRPWDADRRLELAGALRGAGGAADEFAAALEEGALRELVGCEREAAARWRALDARGRRAALAAAARARPALALRLADLAVVDAGPRDLSHNALEVLVAASKLRVLLHEDATATEERPRPAD